MKRTTKKIKLERPVEFKNKLLIWSQQFKEVIWLDSNTYPQKYSSFEAVLAVDAYSDFQCDFQNAFEKLKRYKNKVNDYLFGYLSYDLKNDLEDLSSYNLDGLDFPELYFFHLKSYFFKR